MRCYRPLRNEVSVRERMGPVCRKKVDLQVSMFLLWGEGDVDGLPEVSGGGIVRSGVGRDDGRRG
jgi:hypothetical protein